MPTPADAASAPADQPWYSYDHGPVHFTVMSTEHHFGEGSAQHRWLESDLAGRGFQRLADFDGAELTDVSELATLLLRRRGKGKLPYLLILLLLTVLLLVLRLGGTK